MTSDAERRSTLRDRRERRLLQAAIAVAALVPIGAGAGGVWLGLGLVEASGDAAASSHMRYLSGLLLGIGIAFLCFIPTIERRAREVALLTGIVVLGGLARFLGMILAWRTGEAIAPVVVFALVMELGVTPALCVWQRRLARWSS